MSYNSKYVKAVTEFFQCTSITHLPEGECQKSCESSMNWESYEQTETTYIKESFLQVPPLK